MKKLVVLLFMFMAILTASLHAATFGEHVNGAVKTVDGACQTTLGAVGRAIFFPLEAVKYVLNAFTRGASGETLIWN